MGEIDHRAVPPGALITRVQAAHIYKISLEQVALRITQGYLEHVGNTLGGLALYRERKAA